MAFDSSAPSVANKAAASPLQHQVQLFGERNTRLAKLIERITAVTNRLCGPIPPPVEGKIGGPQPVPSGHVDASNVEINRLGDLLDRLEGQAERLDNTI